MHSFIASSVLLLAAGIPSLVQGQTATTPQCAQAQMLAQGIALNIVDQQSELATANAMATQLKAQPFNKDQYMATRDVLLRFITNGVAIRQMNQQIAPLGNMAIGGLAFVANAQLEELGLAMNLTGNPTADTPLVAQLVQDFTGGIKKNQENQAAALQGCGGTQASTAPAPTGMTMPKY